MTVPGARASILISGPSGAGKSYLAGVLVERWIVDGYKVLVIDPEGEHAALGRYHHAVVIDAADPPSASQLESMMRDPLRSVIVDFSAVPLADREVYCEEVLRVAGASRAERGLPHWTVIDEAHQNGSGPSLGAPAETDLRGHCFVTYLPALLHERTSAVDITLIAEGRDMMSGEWHATFQPQGGTRRAFVVDSRQTAHVRHRRKYAESLLEPHEWFTFRMSDGGTVSVARSLGEFLQELDEVGSATIRHHASRGDFSAWAAGSLHDDQLSERVADIERTLDEQMQDVLTSVRAKLAETISARYLPSGVPQSRSRAPIESTGGST